MNSKYFSFGVLIIAIIGLAFMSGCIQQERAKGGLTASNIRLQLSTTPDNPDCDYNKAHPGDTGLTVYLLIMDELPEGYQWINCNRVTYIGNKNLGTENFQLGLNAGKQKQDDHWISYFESPTVKEITIKVCCETEDKSSSACVKETIPAAC